MSAARKLAKDVYIVAAKRTPFGTYGGVLKDMSPTQLGVVAAEAALTQANLSPEAVDSVVVGNVAQTAADTSYLARHVGLKSGVPIDRPALTINLLCGSGFQSIVNGTQEILCGDAEIVLTGGAESMSSAPFSARSMRFGTKLFTDVPLKETIGESLFDMHAGCPMVSQSARGERQGEGGNWVDVPVRRSRKRGVGRMLGVARRISAQLFPVCSSVLVSHSSIFHPTRRSGYHRGEPCRKV